jgi:hypothetical protein
MGQDNSQSQLNPLLLIAVAVSIIALVVGAVLPQASDIAVDLGLNDLNDVVITSPSNNQIILYNGSYWINTNQPIIASNGSLVPVRWDDLNFPALSLAKSANLAPTQGAIFATGSIQGLLFDGATQVNEVYGSGEILHSYQQGTNLYPHIHWMATTTGAGNVTWFLEYALANVNGVYSTPTIISVSQATTGVAWVHMLSNFPTINGSGLLIGSHITFRLYRNATAPSDTYTDNAALESFGIHFDMDTVGSSQIASK